MDTPQWLKDGIEPPKIAEIMQSINALGVKHPELPRLRKMAIDLAHKNKLDPSVTAYVFWECLESGKPLNEVLEMTEESVIPSARDLQRLWYGELKRPHSKPVK